MPGPSARPAPNARSRQAALALHHDHSDGGRAPRSSCVRAHGGRRRGDPAGRVGAATLRAGRRRVRFASRRSKQAAGAGRRRADRRDRHRVRFASRHSVPPVVEGSSRADPRGRHPVPSEQDRGGQARPATHGEAGRVPAAVRPEPPAPDATPAQAAKWGVRRVRAAIGRGPSIAHPAPAPAAPTPSSTTSPPSSPSTSPPSDHRAVGLPRRATTKTEPVVQPIESHASPGR